MAPRSASKSLTSCQSQSDAWNLMPCKLLKGLNIPSQKVMVAPSRELVSQSRPIKAIWTIISAGSDSNERAEARRLRQ